MVFTKAEQALIREDIFRWLDDQLVAGKYEFSREDLSKYEWRGQRIPLVSQMKGIWNPATFDETLSILTSPNGPYDDRQESDLYLRYSYQARDGGDNIKLKLAYQNQTPLIYFEPGPTKYHYVARYPVFIADDDVVAREFVVALDQELKFFGDPAGLDTDDRAWLERKVRARVHQPQFRARVMTAYSKTCAVCELKHVELLDAAHIIPDTHELGLAVIQNGMALCKIHHAAYDGNFMGITPDYKVVVNEELLLEVDGPMLKHGIQEMHGRTLILPKQEPNWPGKENLAFRFDQFAA